MGQEEGWVDQSDDPISVRAHETGVVISNVIELVIGEDKNGENSSKNASRPAAPRLGQNLVMWTPQIRPPSRRTQRRRRRAPSTTTVRTG